VSADVPYSKVFVCDPVSVRFGNNINQCG